VTANTVTLTAGNGALLITATASGSTLTGSLTCNGTTSAFNAVLVDVTGTWTGTFIATGDSATGCPNTIGAKTNVVVNVTQNAQPGNFPTLTGTFTFTTTSANPPLSALVPLDDKGATTVTDTVNVGFIQGTFVFFDLTNPIYGPPIGGGNDPPNTVDLNGTVAGNMLTVSQYHAPCFLQGIGLTGGVESGNGTLSKQ